MPAIPTLGKLRQEDCCKFENNLDHTVNPKLTWAIETLSQKSKRKNLSQPDLSVRVSHKTELSNLLMVLCSAADCAHKILWGW